MSIRLKPPNLSMGLSPVASSRGAVSFKRVGRGFADIVLEHNQFVTFRLVVECKRVRADDESQLHWIFLLPDLEAGYTELASCFEVEINPSRDGPAKLWDEV